MKISFKNLLTHSKIPLMRFPFLSKDDSDTLFICQISDEHIKILRCLPDNAAQKEPLAAEVIAIPAGLPENELTKQLLAGFKKLGYRNNPLIVSLPRNKATCRYLKAPTQSPDELAKIVSLQASRYLPYPADDLITGHQILSVDPEGYATVNMIIVHKELIQRYRRIFRELKTQKFSIALSSFGLAGLYGWLYPQEQGTVMVVDIDYRQVEVAVVWENKLLFSRSFKVDNQEPGWQSVFRAEIKNTQDTYRKETSLPQINKVAVTKLAKEAEECVEILKEDTGLPVDTLPLTAQMSGLPVSMAGLMGLRSTRIDPALNLLPAEAKEKAATQARKHHRLALSLGILGIVVVLGLGIAKHLDNKARYLRLLKGELDKISHEARPLERIEKRFTFMERYLVKKASVLEFLYELHRIMPAEATLVNFSYEEERQIILHGQAPQLAAVLRLVSALEKSTVFKGYQVKIRYATQKKAARGEFVDFEITCGSAE